MTSGQIIREDAIRRMARTLRSLPTLEVLACAEARCACYQRADIAIADATAHDAAAERVERIRRAAFAAPTAAAA